MSVCREGILIHLLTWGVKQVGKRAVLCVYICMYEGMRKG